ncbi:hypothetical protein EYF80_037983 [Liparis tanakae]|uniref:Uncharacterized protein n=1 Tax=Liparis tanakae TaxID=230148 RepID=A0A4Z2GF60_9TELE|nr:hypothetical protein EYF80_037983 [Liparis tanakae]
MDEGQEKEAMKSSADEWHVKAAPRRRELATRQSRRADRRARGGDSPHVYQEGRTTMGRTKDESARGLTRPLYV